MMLLPVALLLAMPPKDVEANVSRALAKLTTHEKLELIGGYRGFNIQPLPSIQLPEVLMSDGPVGVRNFGPVTAYPAGVCLAASFDPALAQAFGESIGRDALGRGVGIWLGPGVNLARITQNGRNFEYVGEDPWLASRMAVGIINGVQSKGVVATVKHFAANEHENDRNQDSSDVSERVMRELYLKPFEAAVKEANVGAVMCSYNKLNGTYTSANYWLLTKVLKQQWGFQGLVMSDWGAVHNAAGAALGGMDLEMPSGEFMNPDTMQKLLDNGTVKMATIDDKVRRILRVCYRFGFIDAARTPIEPKDDPKNALVARRIADEGIVLLKNRDQLLPLSANSAANRATDLLVLGANATEPITGGGGSSYTTPIRSESLLAALQSNYPGAHGFAEAADPIAAPWSFSGYQDLQVQYFKGKELAGDPVATNAETHVDHVWTESAPSPAGSLNFSARFTGKLVVPDDGDYLAISRSDDGIRVTIDDKLVIDHWSDHGAAKDLARLHLTAGSEHSIKIEYYQGTGEAICQFGLVNLKQISHNPELDAAITKADAVIVAVGFNSGSESEGEDRPFDLPFEQQLMLDQACKLNKHVIIVLNSGAGVNLAPWASQAAGIFANWYPGQEGAAAFADILSGKTNPSGKLPTSFPAALDGTYYASAYPPINHHIAYTEGLLTGYRWFEKKGVKPLFPFGFGLSYTRFALDDVTTRVGGGTITIRARVRNTGGRAGDQVVQVYVGKARVSATDPNRRLQGFARVHLKAGEAKMVTIPVRERELATWDTPSQTWVLNPGTYHVDVQTSAEDIHPLTIKIDQGAHYHP